MGDETSIWLYVVTITALACTPGADVLYIVTRGVGEGRRVALISVAGVCSGYVGHAVLAAIGVSALIASSPTAFEALRWSGVAYLLYLGVKVLRSRDRFSFAGERDPTSTRRALGQGMLTSVLNPKGLVFFLSLLPQFVGANTRLSTTVDADLLDDARRVRAGITDAALIDEALGALLVRHRAAELDASYAVYDEHPLDEPDEWGDLASFRRAAAAS